MNYERVSSFLLIPFYLMCACAATGQSMQTVVQRGHELSVLAVAVSPDSGFVATGSRDKTAKLWDLNTGREVRSFLGHQFSVFDVAFSRDGKLLITGNGDGTAKIWEVASGKEVLSVSTGSEQVTDVAFDPKGKFFVTVSFKRGVIVWEYPSKKIIKELEANGYAGSGGLLHIAISPNGEWLAVGEDNYTVNLYRTKDWAKFSTINTSALHSSCGGCYTDVDFSPDSQFLLKASNHDEVSKYEITTGNKVVHFKKQVDDLSSAAFSPDGKKVVLCTKTIATVYDAIRGDSLYSVNPMVGNLNQAKFTAYGKQLLIACDNNEVLIYNANGSKQKGALTGYLNQRDKGGLNYDPNSYWDSYIAKYLRLKNSLLLSQDNKTLLKGKFGNKLKRWNIATGKIEMEYVGHEKAATCYQYSRDGKKLLTGGGDGTIIVWDVAKGDTLLTIKAYQEPIFDIHFNSDETQILSSSWEKNVKIHDAITGKRLHLFELEEGSAYQIQFSRNDLYVFTATLKGDKQESDVLQMREIDTKKTVRTFEGHTETISSLHVSQDGKKLLTASWDGAIRLWDVASGLTDKKLTAHVGAVHTAIFSHSEKNIFSAGADRGIKQWDVTTGKITRTFEGHMAEVTSLQLTSDEKLLISHSLDGSTKFWDLSSGKEFFEHIHLGESDWMVKNTDGYFSGTDNARKYIYFVDGLKTYSADQFFEEFYRPDLLPKLFQSRGSNDGSKGVQGRLLKSPPPTVKVAVVPTHEGDKADVYVRVSDNGGGVEKLKLFHNGKSVAMDNTFELPKGKDQYTTYHQLVQLIGGNNIFMATASNKDKIEADPHSAEIFSEAITKTSVCYLLAVGINQYKNPRMVLNYARPDAESFEKIVDQQKELYKNVEVHTLLDTDASRAAILSKLEELTSKIHPEDVFIFYYAGHGSMVDDRFFFIPSESARLYDLNSLQKEAIEASALQEKMKNIKALKQLIVMDACQSGGSVEVLANRGAAEEKAIAQLSRSAGIHVMASASSEQFATEFTELGHGLFTYLLLKALQGEADGAPKDGKVTIYELKSYLDDQVPEVTRKLKGKPQYPYTFSRGQDFPIVLER
jgi:WD40 repeat protein